MVEANGTVCYDADFTPFGAELAYPSTCSQNYKFEGEERDTETQNDYFGARYYSSRFGRWLSSDWSGVPAPVPYANLTNPQTLNLYAMVADDPESFADLDGHFLIPTPEADSQASVECNNSQGPGCTGGEPQPEVATPALPKSDTYTIKITVWAKGFTDDLRMYWQMYLIWQRAASQLMGKALQPCGGVPGVACGIVYPIGNLGELGAAETAEGAAEAASEKTATDMAKQIERDLGKNARREFHDLKQGGGDRTLEELKEDAKALYEQYGKKLPNWMK